MSDSDPYKPPPEPADQVSDTRGEPTPQQLADIGCLASLAAVAAAIGSCTGVVVIQDLIGGMISENNLGLILVPMVLAGAGTWMFVNSTLTRMYSRRKRDTSIKEADEFGDAE